MSLQWTFVATLLYVEIFLVCLLLLPFISATRWQKIFRSRLFGAFRSYANLYFNIFIIVLVVLFLDSVRDVRKYMIQHQDIDLRATGEAMRFSIDMKMFRAQRNYYICGFTLFLWIVLRRMVVLIAKEAALIADCEATRKQAQSATDAAKKLMEEHDNQTNEDKNDSKEIAALGKEINILKGDLSHSNTNLDAMKKQAEATNKEYDRLLKEHATLQEKLAKMEGSETKKDS